MKLRWLPKAPLSALTEGTQQGKVPAQVARQGARPSNHLTQHTRLQRFPEDLLDLLNETVSSRELSTWREKLNAKIHQPKTTTSTLTREWHSAGLLMRERDMLGRIAPPTR